MAVTCWYKSRCMQLQIVPLNFFFLSLEISFELNNNVTCKIVVNYIL
jgi:hypothetical protein